MSQGHLELFRSVCGEQYGFGTEWGRLAPHVDWSALFCALSPHHDGRHIDEKTGIPWDRPEDVCDIEDWEAKAE